MEQNRIDSNYLLGILLLLSFLFYLIGNLCLNFISNFFKETQYYFILNFILIILIKMITFIIPYLLYKKLTKDETYLKDNSNFTEKIPPKNPSVSYLLFACFLLFFSVTLIGIISDFALSFFVPNNTNPNLSPKVLDFVFTIISSAIVAPICEELLYRGCVLNLLSKYGYKKAVLFSGFFFALMHYNISQFFYAFIAGIIIGFFVAKTNSVLFGIIIHFFNNFVNLILNYLTNFIPQQQELVILFSILLLCFLYCIIYFFIKRKDFTSQKNSNNITPIKLANTTKIYILIATLFTVLNFILSIIIQKT